MIASGASTAIIQHRQSWSDSLSRLSVGERYARFFAGSNPMTDPFITSVRPVDGIYSPQPLLPQWVNSIEDVIRRSTALEPGDPTDDGRWLRQDVADAGVRFFESAADLLPGEPAIYSSLEGNLVAEYPMSHGSFTTVIGPRFTLLFAVNDGVPSSSQLGQDDNIREQLAEILEPFLSESHGDVEASKRR